MTSSRATFSHLVLTGTPAERREAAALLARAPGYFVRVYGRELATVDADALFDELPPGRTRADHIVWRFDADSEPVGLAVAVRGHPSDDFVYVGLLVIAESHQGRGLGRAACEAVAQWAAASGATRLRLSVVSTNEPARVFWERQGFTATGERKPFEGGLPGAEAVLFERSVAWP